MTPVSPESPPSAFSETRRQIVHITMGGWALLLRWITWEQAAALAIAALIFNLFILPRVGGRRLYRASDTTRGLPIGILLYPLAVLGLVLVFPYRLDIVAAAWGVLAAGDGFATLVGRPFGRTRLPWNPDKSVEGTVAFIVFGSAAGVLLALWVRTPGSVAFATTAPIVAAIIAALVETIPVRLDDNISVPFAAGLTLWFASLVSFDARDLSGLVGIATSGLMLNIAVAVAGWLARTVSVSGGVAGVTIGTVIFAGAGWRGWLLLFISFVAASVASRLGLRRKLALGIAEERGGRRGFGNAIANTGIAACWAALLVLGRDDYSAGFCYLLLTAALVAGASDTVASEIGKAWGRRTFLVTSFRPVRPGTPGAVSVEGTLAGIAAALGLAFIAASLGLLEAPLMRSIGIVVTAATLASFIESVLGATLEPRGILNNDLLNFVTTWSATVFAFYMA
jgi:uncharacterized protein (TIGR00297 family)